MGIAAGAGFYKERYLEGGRSGRQGLGRVRILLGLSLSHVKLPIQAVVFQSQVIDNTMQRPCKRDAHHHKHGYCYLCIAVISCALFALFSVCVVHD